MYGIADFLYCYISILMYYYYVAYIISTTTTTAANTQYRAYLRVS
jgi:hypothetical protein